MTHLYAFCQQHRSTLGKPSERGEFHFSFIATEECKCSCNDVILAAIVGVLVFIIIGLILYIVWLRKKGKTILTFSSASFFFSAVVSNRYTVPSMKLNHLIFVSQALLENRGRFLSLFFTCGLENGSQINSAKSIEFFKICCVLRLAHQPLQQMFL